MFEPSMLQTFHQYIEQSTSIVFSLPIIGVLTACLHAMIPEDSVTKKFGLALGLVICRVLTSVQGYKIASTCQFLYEVMIIQIFMMGIFSFIAGSNNKLKQTFIACLFFIINGLGLVLATNNGYHLELFNSPNETWKMLMIVGGGFSLVWIADRLLAENLNFSPESRRKIFHLVPIAILPFLHQIQYTFFTLMLTGSFYLFLQLEIIRYFLAPLFRIDPKLIKWMGEFNTTREPNFWFTHLFLIMGLSLTYFYFQGSLANASLVLVAGDAAAAIVGRRYGRTRIQGTKKTLEGLLGFLLCVILCQFMILKQTDTGFILASSLFCGLVEVYSGDLDNLALPLAFIFIHQLFSRI